MDSPQTAGSLIFTDQTMMADGDSQQDTKKNPPTLTANENPDETNTKSDTDSSNASVEITDQIMMADGDSQQDSKENPPDETNTESNTDASSNASGSQEIEITEVFYYNPNNHKRYNDVSEFSDNEDDI